MTIRPARPDDLDELMRLCAEHAEYERLTPPAPAAAQALATALWGPSPRAWCLVAAQDGHLSGYATYSLEFATWTGREYAHLDCLYLRPAYRGRGLGRKLLDQATLAAVELGATELQWQTPDWNADAIAFYSRIGATARPKVRFTLAIGG